LLFVIKLKMFTLPFQPCYTSGNENFACLIESMTLFVNGEIEWFITKVI